MALPSLNLLQSDVLTVLRSFLLSVLPVGTEVVRGQENRVPEPLGPDFVIMTPMMRERLETNVDLYADCAFVASISGATLSVAQMLHGAIQTGNALFGVGVPAGTTISGTVTGSGGVGDYALSGSLGTISSETMASGVFFALQPTEITVQLDVYGPNSADNAQIISTLFRDDFAVEQFKAFGAAPPGWQSVPPGGTVSERYVGMAPLYADDPRQSVFVSGEEQYELRWIVDACIQANQIVTAPQQFAGVVKVSPLVPVDAFYPVL